MIKASLIYTAVTILLALIDAYRIKKAKGVVENINHELSAGLAIVFGLGISVFSVTDIHLNALKIIIHWNIVVLACIAIRLAFYDPTINLWRRMRIDYESPTTSSCVDQHTNKLSFWLKRLIGLAGWVVCYGIHTIIFKTV